MSATSCKVLLICDRSPDRQRRLKSTLGILGPCVALPLGPPEQPPLSPSMIVCDVQRRDAVAVSQLRALLAHHRSGGTPVLSFIDAANPAACAQAFANGSSEIMCDKAGRAQIVDKVRMMLFAAYPGIAGRDEIARGYAAKACAAFAEMMDAAECGNAIPVDAISTSADMVLQAVQKTDVKAWLNVVSEYDDRTFRHCLLVAGLSAAFAQKLRFSLADRKRLTQAALLHDIGKAGVSLQILNKPGRLTEAEMAEMRKHPVIGYDMLVRQGGFDSQLLSVVRHHHESIDGTGYPDGLKGAEIGDLVRLVTICDIYAALIEPRPYKASMSRDESMAILDSMGGKLDMQLLAAFRDVATGCFERQAAA